MVCCISEVLCIKSQGKPTKGTVNILLADSKGFDSAQNIHVLQGAQILGAEETAAELQCKASSKML